VSSIIFTGILFFLDFILFGLYPFSEVMIGENRRFGFCCVSWFDLEDLFSELEQLYGST